MIGKFRLKGFLVVCLVVFFSWGLAASGNIVVQLRFYQGFNQKGDATAVISGSYYLRKISEDKVIPYMEGAGEAQKLEAVYKLKEVKQAGSLEIVLKSGGKYLYRTGIRLNGRDLVLDLETIEDKADRFIIKISQKGTDKEPLLDSEIIVPREKTAVLGFKDSGEKIYFIAFNRKNGENKQTLAEMLGAKSIIKPKCLKSVEPGYPAEAVKSGIEGDVVTLVRTDLEGNIHDVTLLNGHPMLAATVKEALKKWNYSVWEVDGVKKPVQAYLVFIYYIEKTPPVETDKLVKETLERLKSVMQKEKDQKGRIPVLMEVMLIKGEK